MTADESWTMRPSREETLAEFIDRVCDGEESRREVAQKFEDTFRDVIVTMTKARDMILDLMERRDKSEARFKSLLEIGPVATERERCGKILQHYGVEEDWPPLDIIKKIRSGEDAPG